MSAPSAGAAQASGPPWGGSRLGQLLALVGLTGLAISQPLLSVLGENPTLFVFNNVDGWRLVLFALGVAFVPPLIIWLVVVVIGFASRRLADVVFVAVATVLTGLAVVQLLKWVGLTNAVIVSILALVMAAAFAAALVRFSVVYEWVRYLAILPVLAVALFLVVSPTHDLLNDRDAAARTAAGDLAPVVFVMLDEFPTKSLLGSDGGIDRVRYPNLATLAGGSTWYRNYTVQATWTEISVPAILSGQEPRGGGAGLWTDYPDTLFSLLAPTHELTAFESFTALCGYASCGVEGASGASNEARTGELLSRVGKIWGDRVTPGVTTKTDLGEFGELEALTEPPTDAASPLWEGDTSDAMGRVLRAMGTRPARAQAFIDSMQSDDERGLYYLHLLYPHQPWTVDPQGMGYVDEDAGAPAVPLTEVPEDDEPTEWDKALQEQRYLWQAAYTDQVVGQVLDRLRETGLYDESLVIVTADHGVAFDGGLSAGRRVTEDTISDLAYAPLFVKLPGQSEGQVDDSDLMSVDLLPTIADALGVTIPWPVAGYPAGSPEILERSGAKKVYDFLSPSSTTWERVLEFDDAERPVAAQRSIVPATPNASPVAGLVAAIGVEDQLGRSVNEYAPTSVASVSSESLKALREPVTAYVAPVTALVEGELAEDVSGGHVLVALNGVVVTAAPVENGHFRTIVPPAAVRRSGNDVRVLLVTGNELIELDAG
jgi:hypothetical protein